MTCAHEAFVAARFDALCTRFKSAVSADDSRLEAVLNVLGSVKNKRILDIGCGKGRFARHLQDQGAEVVGIDLSRSMLSAARHINRFQASASRLPFADACFDALIAIEVLEHLPTAILPNVLSEMRRVLRSKAPAVVIDKNALALDAKRPWLPRVIVKWIDEHRGLWMYKPGEPVRETWFRPSQLLALMNRYFKKTHIHYLLGPAERDRFIFTRFPWTRAMVCWSGHSGEVPGGAN